MYAVLLLLLFPFDQHIKTVSQLQISLIIHKIIHFFFFGLINACNKVKIKSGGYKFGFMDVGFTGWIQFFQYPPIFFQPVVCGSDKLTIRFVFAVIVGIATIIRTKFFVGSSQNRSAAFQTLFFHRGQFNFRF